MPSEMIRITLINVITTHRGSNFAVSFIRPCLTCQVGHGEHRDDDEVEPERSSARMYQSEDGEQDQGHRGGCG